VSISKVDYNSLYRLTDPFAAKPLRLALTGYSRSLTWEQLVGLYTGRFQPDQPVQLLAFKGGRLMDVLWTDFTLLVVISQRLVELLRGNSITGWSTFPVEVSGRKGERLPGYYGFAIVGRAGPIDTTRGELVIKPPVVPGGAPRQVRRGLYFDETRWDGSDVFVLGQGGFIVVRAKVKHVLDRAQVRNILLTSLVDVELDKALDKIAQHRSS